MCCKERTPNEAPCLPGAWTQRDIPHVKGVYGGKRGRLAVSRDNDLYLILPDHESSTLTILKASTASRYTDYTLVWKGNGFPPTEPLVDVPRLEYDNVLSIFTRANVDGASEAKNVVVLDFQF